MGKIKNALLDSEQKFDCFVGEELGLNESMVSALTFKRGNADNFNHSGCWYAVDLYCFQKYPSIRFSDREIDCFEYAVHSVYFGEDFEEYKSNLPYEISKYGMPLTVMRQITEKWKKFLERKDKCSI